MPISIVPGVGLDSGSSGVAPSNLSTGGPSWSGAGYLTSQINSATAGQYAPMYFFRLDSGLAGANVNTAQNTFGVGVTLSSSTVYAFDAVVALSKSAGATGHVLNIGFGGTATVNNISYSLLEKYNTTSFLNLATSDTVQAFIQTASSTAISGTLTSATGFSLLNIRGTVSINAGGTFIPQYTLSAAPGGAYTTAAGSYFLIYPIGASGSNTNIGGWA